MKRIIGGIIPAIFAASLFSACATPETTTTVTGGGPTIGEARAEAYNGPKARLAVNKFANKSAHGQGKLGTGMSDMLTTALFQSNRFIVLDRTDSDAVLAEQDLGASGRIDQKTAAPIGKMEGAELLVTGAVTAFDPDTGGVLGGVGVGLGGGAGVGVGGGGRQAYMAIDLKVTDTRTGRIVAATTVEGKSTDWVAGLGAAIGGVPIPFGLVGYQKTPAEKAIRVVIVKAVEYLSSQTPASYYHQ